MHSLAWTRTFALISLSLGLAASGCGGTAPASCGAGLLDCGASCVNPTADSNNCGACGKVCPGGTVCQSAVCVSQSHFGQPGGGVPAGAEVYRILPGASTVVEPGTTAGYGITANVGGSYRLVWTGDGDRTGQYHEFWGSIYTPGHFTSITDGCAGGVCALQADDQLSTPLQVSGGERIDFDSVADDTLNGFDFVVSAEPVYFDVFIDGQRYPDLIFFPATDNGGQISNAASLPFGLTTQ